MGNMLSYSGISTKIRAMQSKLINEQQLAEIAQLTSVPQVVSYLKKTPQYGAVWSNVDENALHRGEIEVMLKKTIFQNFSQIYSFADKEQRKFLMLYSKRYEIRVLKELLANIFDHRDTPRINPVSYTHLDVYKRQALLFPGFCIPFIFFRSGSKSEMPDCRSKDFSAGGTALTVSSSHG